MDTTTPNDQNSDRIRHMDTTASTRRVMIGAFAGALLVLVATTTLGWQVGPESPSAQDGPARALREAPAGTCLTWTKNNASDAKTVGCDQPHLFELTGPADISADFPKDAPYPDDTRWQGIAKDRCTEVSVQYLEGRFDPNGKISVTQLKFSERAWSSGDRVVRCGLQASGPSKLLYPTVGSAKTIDQSDVHATGTCLGISVKSVGDPVECTKPHAYEVVGVVNLGAQFPQEFPAEGKQDDALREACTKQASDFAGGGDKVTSKGLTVYWDTRKQESWLAGSKRVECKVGAGLPDKSGLAPVTGSVKGLVSVGKEPAPLAVPTLPPGAPAPAGSPGTDVSADAPVPTDAPVAPPATTQPGG